MLGRKLNKTRFLAFNLTILGMVLAMQGEHEAGVSSLDESLSQFRDIHDEWGLAFALDNKADAISWSADYMGSKRLHEESLAIFQRLEDRHSVVGSLFSLGSLHLNESDYEMASHRFEQALAIQIVMGNRQRLAFIQAGLAYCAFMQDNYEKASSYLSESLAHFKELGITRGITRSLRYLIYLALRMGDYSQAITLFRNYLGIASRSDEERTKLLCLMTSARIATSLGENKLAEPILSYLKSQKIWLEGLDGQQLQRSLDVLASAGTPYSLSTSGAVPLGTESTVQDLMLLANEIGNLSAPANINQEESSQGQPAHQFSLSKREIELLRLVAVGLNNRDIASRLFLSPNTVRAHLYSIYNKIDVESRTGAVRFATLHNLL